MGIKNVKPVTPGQRWRKASSFDEITKKKPEKALLSYIKKRGGRNNLGRVTSNHRGGGHKKKYRIIDYKRDKYGIEAKIAGIEYDPNRSARVALLHYKDGEKRYILAPMDLKVGDIVQSGPDAPIKIGNSLPLRNIPPGAEIHNVEVKPGSGGKLVRSAGTSAQLLSKEGKYAHIRMPSGEVRLILQDCYATIGRVGNVEYSSTSVGKAGRSRWLGKRPRVRGIAMNPVDHPMGGGEGRSKSGEHPRSPSGLLSKGYRTRKKKKYSNRLIVKRRK